MSEIKECLRLHTKITQLQVLEDDKVALASISNGIKILSSQECRTVISSLPKTMNEKTTAVAFSSNGKLLAYANPNIIYIVDIQTNTMLRKIDVENEIVDILMFDPSSNYLIAGTKNGRVLQYKNNSNILLSRLCSFPFRAVDEHIKIKDNYVSAFAFFKNKIACSGYGGTIFVIDLQSRVNKNIITHSSVRVDAICFLDENRIISGNIDGSLDIIRLNDKDSYKRIYTPLTKIKQILLMPNPNYIIINSDKNHLTLVDIANYKVIDDKYIEFEDDIDKITLLNDSSMFVSLKNSVLLNVELPSIGKLKSLISNNMLDKAFELVNSEPMIRNSKEHMKLEELYKSYYLNSVKALITDNIDLAKQLTSMFKDLPSKKDEIELLFNAFKNYEHFKLLVMEKKYSLSYSMCEKYPALKYTKEYKHIEKIWKNKFLQAQKNMMHSKKKEALHLLADYMTIASKKPLIKFILNNNEQLLEFLSAIEKREFSKINKFVKENKIFEQVPNYIALNKEIDENLLGVKDSLKTGKTKLAREYLKKLEDIPYLVEKVKKLKQQCDKVEHLYSAYNRDDFNSCYELLDTYSYLSDTNLGISLEKEWSKIITKCEEYAVHGNIKKIKALLGKFVKLSKRRDKIGDLFRVSFQSRIKYLINKEEYKKARKLIYLYLDIFGLDKEIREVNKYFKDESSLELPMSEDQARIKPRNIWTLNDMLIDNK